MRIRAVKPKPTVSNACRRATSSSAAAGSPKLQWMRSGSPGKTGAAFGCPIANGDHVIERFATKPIEALGIQVCAINPESVRELPPAPSGAHESRDGFRH
jgi:hypothetical protein